MKYTRSPWNVLRGSVPLLPSERPCSNLNCSLIIKTLLIVLKDLNVNDDNFFASLLWGEENFALAQNIDPIHKAGRSPRGWHNMHISMTVWLMLNLRRIKRNFWILSSLPRHPGLRLKKFRIFFHLICGRPIGFAWKK